MRARSLSRHPYAQALLTLLLSVGLSAAESATTAEATEATSRVAALMRVTPPVAEIPELPREAHALPVLHQGRVKPLAVACEELVYAITGYGRFGEPTLDASDPKARLQRGAAVPPAELVVDWLRAPAAWRSTPFLYAPHLELQTALGLRGQWATPEQADSPIVDAAVAKRERADATKQRIELTPVERAAYDLAGRRAEARAALAGETFAFFPLAPDAAGRAWALGVAAQLLDEERAAHAGHDHAPGAHVHADLAPWRARLLAIAVAPEAAREKRLREADIWIMPADLRADDALLDAATDAGVARATAAARSWMAAVRAADSSAIATATATLVDAARAQGARSDGDASESRASYPSAAKIRAEQIYVRARPFTWAWLGYVLGGIAAAIGVGALARSGGTRGRGWYRAGVALTVIGMLFTLYGLGTRLYITSLGAVTNLYETVVYVALVCAALGLVFARITRNGAYAAAGGVAAGLCAAVGEALPPDLGSHLGQLQPVLRSKFWLWTHVKVIVASYAAFLLALALGNAALIRAAVAKRAVTLDESRAIYRCLQVGVVLIAAGTLLGAVWADEAWGRFWGWDPKEVWALVILLTYLVPLHLRHAGVVGTTGLAAWAVFGFLSVVMSWYGVNFILGTGLHAYAFGDGGQQYVLPLCGLQVLVAIWALLVIPRGPALRDAADRVLPTEVTGKPD